MQIISEGNSKGDQPHHQQQQKPQQQHRGSEYLEDPATDSDISFNSIDPADNMLTSKKKVGNRLIQHNK